MRVLYVLLFLFGVLMLFAVAGATNYVNKVYYAEQHTNESTLGRELDHQALLMHNERV